MEIKKRTTMPPVSTADTQAATYEEYREAMWNTLHRTDFSFGNSCFMVGKNRVSLALTQVVLQPKITLFFKDVWHCGGEAKAREMVAKIATFPDVFYMEFRGHWVWVDYRATKSTVLEGQQVDDRQRYRGR